MQTVRQLSSGIIYAAVSLLLVVGALSLSLAQGRNTASSASPSSTAVPATATRSPASQPIGSTVTQPAMSATAPVPSVNPSATSLNAGYTATARAPTARPASTATRRCGAPNGWVQGYVVQPGDTLYHIATMYGTTVTDLQRANCRNGTLIYAGELLWVPFVLSPPTALTIIPTFDTPTSEPIASVDSATAEVIVTVDP